MRLREGIPDLNAALDAFLDDVGIRRAKLTRRTYELRLRCLREMKDAPTTTVGRLLSEPEGAEEEEGLASWFAATGTCEVPYPKDSACPSAVSLAVLTPSRCRSLVAAQVQRYAPATVECFAGALKAFVKFCRAEGWMLDDPTAHLAYPKPTVKPVRILSQQQLEALYGCTRDDSERLSLILLGTGLRAAELLSLCVEDIDGDLVLVKGKGARWRYIPLPTKARPLLPKSGRFVPWHYHTLKYRISQLGKRAKVGRLTPHMFRHEFASTGVEHHDLLTIQIVGGWSSDQMLRRYARATLQKAAARKLLDP